MKYSFADLAENILTRKFGGTTKGVADPYLTGYHFIWFDKIPAKLPDYAGMSKEEIQNILAATCTGVTPPGGTLNKVEYTGLGGVKWAVPGNIDYGNTVSVKFIEMAGTPILKIMHGWVKMIRDYRLGITDADLAGTEGDSKKSLSAMMYYWTTTPNGQDVEYYACYDGMFPGKDPQDLYTSDVETVGKLDVEIEFNVDYAWHEDWVKNNIDGIKEVFKSAANTVKGYSY